MIPLIDKVKENSTAFEKKVVNISSKLNIPEAWLMFVMWFESKLNHRAVNSNTNATGLIQFMPATATRLGTNTTALKNMSNVDQLDYVYKYLQPMKGKMKSLQDVYLSVFFPAAVGKPDNYVLSTSKLSAQTIARANKIFDLDDDEMITVGEIKSRLVSSLPESVQKIIYVLKKNPAKGVVGGLTVLTILYLLFKK